MLFVSCPIKFGYGQTFLFYADKEDEMREILDFFLFM